LKPLNNANVQSQKSREKNTGIEETRRRNEASMARKHALKLGASNSSSVSGTDTPPSPAASGAMDDLLAKLRAAKPEARDQRDRRRRARLKDRHAVRVASGQTMQDMASLVDKRSETIEASLLSPASEASMEAPSSDGGDAAERPVASDDEEDVAERAASMLEGLRGEVGASDDGDGPDRPGLAREDSARIRRRRESAQDERAARRRRRQQAQSASEQSLGYPAIAEEAELEPSKRDSSGSAEGSADGDIDVAKVRPPPPVTVVHPPSPQVARALPTPPGEE